MGVVEQNTILLMLGICLIMICLFFLFSKLSFDYHNKQLLQQLPMAEAKMQMAILKLESIQAQKTKAKIKTSKNLIRVNT